MLWRRRGVVEMPFGGFLFSSFLAENIFWTFFCFSLFCCYLPCFL